MNKRDLENALSDSLVALVFIFLALINMALIYRAEISALEIKLTKTRSVKWEEVDFLDRVGTLYFLKAKGRARVYIFPLGERPIFSLVRETTFDQFIGIMKKKHNI